MQTPKRPCLPCQEEHQSGSFHLSGLNPTKFQFPFQFPFDFQADSPVLETLRETTTATATATATAATATSDYANYDAIKAEVRSTTIGFACL